MGGGPVDVLGRSLLGARWESEVALRELGGTFTTSSVAYLSHRKVASRAKNINAYHSLTFRYTCPLASLQICLSRQYITMSSWLPESHRLQLALTALASGCIAATAVIGLQNAKRWYTIHDLKGSIPDLSSKHDVEKVSDYRYCLITQPYLNNPFRSTTSAAPPNAQRRNPKKTNAASPSPAAPAWATTTKP